MADVHAFRRALEALCRKHGVRLLLGHGKIAVYSASEGLPHVGDLLDLTVQPEAERPPPRETLPYYFETHISAKEHPGYRGYAISQQAAEALGAAHPGAQVVPIGQRRIRGYVVIVPGDG